MFGALIQIDYSQFLLNAQKVVFNNHKTHPSHNTLQKGLGWGELLDRPFPRGVGRGQLAPGTRGRGGGGFSPAPMTSSIFT